MIKKNHIERHKELHRSLDELLADFIDHTKRFPSKTTVIEFMEWSFKQTIDPDDNG